MWEVPDIDGGVGIDNYTITVTTPIKTNTITTGNMSANLQLFYDVNYYFEVFAANCLGRSVPDSKTIFYGEVVANNTLLLYTLHSNIHTASCGHPSPPANGTIESYNSTQEGTEIQFHCNEGHIPREWMTSQCQENGSWTPDPVQWNCTKHLPGLNTTFYMNVVNVFYMHIFT